MAAGGLPEDGDAAEIASEGPDVVPDPGEGGDLVQQAPVGGGVGEDAVAEGAEPVVERDQDDPVPGEGRSVVDGDGGGPPGEGAPVDPHHDRQPGPGRGVGGPHVEVQAVVAGDLRVREQRRVPVRVGHFGSGGPEGARVAYPVPGGRMAGGGEPERSDGRGGVGDAAEDADAALLQPALDHAVPGAGPGPGAARWTHRDLLAAPSRRGGTESAVPGTVAHPPEG